jgi:hypothetical protein
MNDPEIDPAERLARLLAETGYRTLAGEGGQFAIPFNGTTREWWIMSRATASWLNLRTFMCDVPVEGVLRNELYGYVLEKNAMISLAKFITIGGQVVLELDYRYDDVDPHSLGSLVRLIYDIAEEHYPTIFRIVSGDHALQSLEAGLKSTEAGPEGD